jgi:cbb3-type cytochrome c oxidase subunit III
MPDRKFHRRISLVFCALLCASLGACGPFRGAPASTPVTTGQAPEAISTAPAGSAALYQSHCSACHGPDGQMVEGVTSSVSITHPRFLSLADDDYLFASIARGRPGANGRGHPGSKMPAFGHPAGPILEDAQIRLIIGFLRSQQREASVSLAEFSIDTGDSAAGAKIYAGSCASCHGANGWGEVGPRLAGETFQDSASNAYIRQTLLEGRPGTAMPAFDFDDQQMADLITFLRSLGADDAG